MSCRLLDPPVVGTLPLEMGQSVVTRACGQFDLAPHLGQPPKPAGLSDPGDWDEVVREIGSGQLTLHISCRGLELEPAAREAFFWGLRDIRLAVKLATWSTWLPISTRQI